MSVVSFRWLRFSALLEGSSLLLLLLVAVPLKRLADMPEAVAIVGPIHGVLFLFFISMLFSHAARGDLSAKQTLIGFIASFIPTGTFIYKAKVLKST
ncbi:DUF3817 domain-containing protein [Thiomicrorhabdus heinhorstiae]|uniref:DUF3817 domain-containing protein n=1 Tax=Thiomicrorhabdus heinhorstiae TaxID=2748010 RepID=A0ABS0BT62_9GAMM|nr:DUF3817 domain-containing protein [Thiomicrorhabdus heinhorstiae]MBF6057045.1 DUF3817 domain-containing protein [Thiomicrorhabdus heinhorstiae]